MSTLAINPTEVAPLPYDLANVPEGYFDRATNPERLRDLKTGARDMFSIPPSMICVEEGHNPRNYSLPENRAHLDELKRSIAQVGVLSPLWVRFDVPSTGEKKTAVLVDGECRLRAVLELIAEGTEIRSVPVIQVEGKSETERLLLAITANTGKPLSKWELGGAFQRLYGKGLSHEEIATKTGYLEAFIVQCIELADAPDEVKQLLSSQAITPALALSELRTNGAAAVQTLQTIANEHKASGKKGAAKRAKAPVKAAKASNSAPAAAQTAPAPAPAAKSTIPQSNITKAILSLVEDIPAEDLNDVEGVAVVPVKKLLKLLEYVITPADLKAVGAKVK